MFPIVFRKKKTIIIVTSFINVYINFFPIKLFPRNKKKMKKLKRNI